MDTTLDWELMAIIGLLCGIWRLLFEMRKKARTMPLVALA